MDIFEYAMQMEKDGEAYYRQLAEQTNNNGLKTVFSMLADEVVKQMKTQSPQMEQTQVLTNAKNIFVQMKESDDTFDFDARQVELYKKAQDIEKKSQDFYSEKASEVTQEDQKETFQQLAAEEEKHYLLLDNIIQFVSRPDTWLENAEFHHLEPY